MPVASQAAARDAILALFKAAWDAQATPPTVYYDDVVGDPPGDEAYAVVQVRHNTSGQATFGTTGNRKFDRTGLVTVQIFTPYGGGMVQADALAQVAQDAFEGKSADSGAIWFREVRVQEIGQDGEWFQTNVTATFEYQVKK